MSATVLQMRKVEQDEAVTCCSCGVEFASPVVEIRRRDGKLFYCPNGHSQSFTKSEATKLREQLETEKLRRERVERDLEWSRAEARNHQTQRVRAQNKPKKVITRVNAGVCPHCNRTFPNIQRHMCSKHADEVVLQNSLKAEEPTNA